jgi:hypothetical protein
MILAPTLQQLAAAELLGGGMEPLPHAAGQGEGEGVTDSAQKRGKTPCRGYQWIIYIYTHNFVVICVIIYLKCNMM